MSGYGSPKPFTIVAAGILAVLVALAAILGLYVGTKSMHRHQAISDANNKVRVSRIQAENQVRLTDIQVGTTAQKVRIAKQEAEIRLQTAIGVREAQDEIAKTLTPLYVQFEMVDALKEIAKSGSNNSVVFIPSGANGVPLVGNLPALQGKR